MKLRICLPFLLAILFFNVALPFFTIAPFGQILICTESGFKFVDAKNALPGDTHKKSHCPFCTLTGPYSLPPLAKLTHHSSGAIASIADSGNVSLKSHSAAHFTPRGPPIVL